MRLPVTKEQMEFLRSIGVEDRDYSAEEIESDVIDRLVSCLLQQGFRPGEAYSETNAVGDLCESIIDALSEVIP